MSLVAGLMGGVAGGKRQADQNAQNERMTAALDALAAQGGGQGRPPFRGADMGTPFNPPSSDQAPPRAGAAPGDASLMGLVDRTEGGGRYDTLFGHAQRPGGDDPFDGVDVSQMTIGQLGDFASPSGEYGQWVKDQVGRVATPMGRHQIVGTTLRRTAEQMGLSPDTKFTPQVQDQMFEHLAGQRLASAGSLDGKMNALRQEWEGFKHVSDDELARAIQNYEARSRGRGVRPTA